jgi:hypothetical protein
MSPAVIRASVGLAALFGAALVACATSSTRAGFDEPDGGASSSSSSSGSSGFGTVEAGANEDGCSDQAKLVYVLSLEGDLYSFAPADKKFTKVGPLNCALNGQTWIPISMAVDRDAVAWVNMRDPLGLGEDRLFKVDTKTADCTSTPIQGRIGGMGFSTNAGSATEETLFIGGEGTNPGEPGVARVDFKTNTIVPVGDFPELVDLELTGTGDGRLFGFLIGTPLSIAQIDKSTIALSNKKTLTGVPKPASPAFAFSFWGGDFYVYVATALDSSSTTNVARYRPADGSIDTSYMTQIGFHIVGAGVSTCAPTSSPK